MGLDFTSEGYEGQKRAHWSYSGFNSFRTKLAKDIGVNLKEMEGFGGKQKWATVKDDLVLLLHHSDCDGHLSPAECERIAPRLREIVSRWDNEIPLTEGIPKAQVEVHYDKQQALLLADQMDYCVSRNVNLIFC